MHCITLNFNGNGTPLQLSQAFRLRYRAAWTEAYYTALQKLDNEGMMQCGYLKSQPELER